MAIRLSPGYDHAVDEKPSRNSLYAMAAGMSITGIPAAKLDASVLVVAINDSTSVSNLPQDGALWVDAQNNLWGRNKWGNVIVRRALGGWESNRYQYGDVTLIPGRVARGVSTVAGGSNMTETHLRTSTGNGYDGSAAQVCVAQETAVSHATAHARFCFMGPTRLHSPDFGPNFGSRRGLAYMRGAFSNNWTIEAFAAGFGQNYQAMTSMRDPTSTNTDVLGYYFGLLMKSI